MGERYTDAQLEVTQVTEAMDTDDDLAIDVHETIELLEARSLTLEAFVTRLQIFLTSKSGEKRCRGLRIVSEVIRGLSKGYLNAVEGGYIFTNNFCHFFINFLQDQYFIVNIALKTLHFLFKNYQLSGDEAVNFITTLNREVPVAQQPIEDRFVIYQIIGILLEKYLEYLTEIKSDFLFGFIQAIEGERDPRCLLVTFKLFVNITENFTLGIVVAFISDCYLNECSFLGHLDEEMFEVISCYFPITYSPPENVKYDVSRQDLCDALQDCFKASPSFAPYSIPLILEKLESDLESSKIDAYNALTACCPVYGYRYLESFLPLIWSNIRIDTLKSYTTMNMQISSALETLKAIVKTISSNDDILDDFLEIVFKDLEPTLRKLELYLLKSTVKIFTVIASCDVNLYEKVWRFVFPHVLEQFTFRSTSDKKDTIEVFVEFFRVASTLNFSNADYKLPHRESVLHICISVLSSEEVDLHVSALDALESILLSPLHLSEEEQKSKVLKVLRSFVSRYHQTTRSVILPILFGNIGDCVTFECTESTIQAINALKYCLFDGTTRKEYISLGINVIINTLKEDHKSRKRLRATFSQNLVNVINDNLEDEILYEDCLNPLKNTVIHLCLCNDDEDFIRNANLTELQPLFSVTSAGFRRLSVTRTKECVDAVIGLLLLHSYTQLLPKPPPTCHCDLNKNMEMQLFLNDPYLQILMCFVHSLFCNMRENVTVPYISGLITKLLSFVEYENPLIVDLSIKAIASLINKMKNEEVCLVFDNITEHISHMFQSGAKQKAVDLLIWVNKGLVTSSKSEARGITEKLISILHDEDDKSLVMKVSSGFTFVHESCEELSCESNARISPFYHQKFYFETLQPLMQGFTNELNTKWRKQAFALAILGQLKFLSNNLLKAEFKKIRSLINFSLQDIDNIKNQEIALDCILHLMDTNSSLLKNIETTVFQLLRLSKASNLLRIRQKALNCLALIPTLYGDRSLLPLRNQVVGELRLALDDKKRVVRYAATDARLKWILIGQPK
ncbi:hypothetical protein B4U80_12993 [Leptotrombidium deliense]|uniref:MMS19 nucleotide excision repair protein n=1 Tax=Leptotrombidium deliense TaxID=299467 RepID=A0A443SFF6_9ACAR|nr:hypothetical protein B4U80_12993 [Leptotrombidium deliense]